MTSTLEIKDATSADLPKITEIYNDAVRNTTAIWNETIVDLKNRTTWLSDQQAAKRPVLVAYLNNAPCGYATYGQWRPHDGFRDTVEHSVYVGKAARGQGVAQTLMRALIERAQADGKRIMIGAISSDNAASISLHERLGFSHSGTLPNVGQKFGRWLDLSLMTLDLAQQS